jgi:hypothetical protein
MSPKAPRLRLGVEVGRWAAAQLTALLLLTHALFFYSEFVGFGAPSPTGDCPNPPSHIDLNCRPNRVGMVNAELVIGGSYESRGIIARGLSSVDQQLCGAACPQKEPIATTSYLDFLCSSIACDNCASGLLASQDCDVDVQIFLMHYSFFGYLVLSWTQDQNLNCTPSDPNARSCTGQYPGRPIAVLLFTFALLWPHVRLLGVHIAFYLPLTSARRRRIHHALANTGKLAFAGVTFCTGLIRLFTFKATSSFVDLWGDVGGGVIGACERVCAQYNGTLPLNCAARESRARDRAPAGVLCRVCPGALIVRSRLAAGTQLCDELQAVATSPMLARDLSGTIHYGVMACVGRDLTSTASLLCIGVGCRYRYPLNGMGVGCGAFLLSFLADM